jgi:radical SAM protein with 4Fe4S-binding SPASM domain
MGISPDGPGQELLRGEEIFKTKSVVSTIQQLDKMYPKIQYSFNPVVSAQNFDLFAINDFFCNIRDTYGLTNARISFTLGRIYDETNSQNSADHVIGPTQIPRFKEIVEEYHNKCIDQLLTKGVRKDLPLMMSNIFHGTDGVMKHASALKHKVPVTFTSGCGADSSDILSIDIQGNVRLCPHTSEKYIAGRIDNLKGIRIVQLDLDRKKTHCSDCNVRRICKSSCPIKFPDEVFLQNCRIEKIWYGAVQRKAFRLLMGEEVELLELGIENISTAKENENIC